MKLSQIPSLIVLGLKLDVKTSCKSITVLQMNTVVVIFKQKKHTEQSEQKDYMFS